MKRLTLAAMAVFTLFGAAVCTAQAEDFPSRPIRIIVPFAPGDSIDNTARVMSERMHEVLGVPVIVQNIAGGGGSTGLAEVVKAPADGYTLAMASTGALTAGPLISESGFTADDFIPLAQLVENPLAVAVAANSPIKSMEDLIQAAQKGTLTYSTPGPTTKQRISMTQFAREHGLNLTHVGGQGGNGAVMKALSGEVDFVFTATPVYLSLYKGGKLRVLAVGADERVPYMPDVPTYKELGYSAPDNLWFGLIVRKDTPATVVKKLSQAVSEAAHSQTTRDIYAKLMFIDAYLDGPAFQEVITKNIADHKIILERLGLLKK